MADAYALEGLAEIGAFFFVLYGPWQWACTDAARQSLFHTRDKLFDIAREGRLDFASPEYRTIRDSFDRQIRFAHSLSLVRLVMFARTSRPPVAKGNAARLALDQISDEYTQAEVKGLLDKLDKTLIIMLIAKSPLLTFVVSILLMVSVSEQFVKTAHQRSTVDFPRTVKEVFGRLAAPPTARFAPLIHEEAAVFRS